jgi:cytochrome c-type biogenesis protein CcmF
MILGLDVTGFRLGSSPFILLREVFYDAPIFIQNPDHIPTNGTGLNALLQNYWMVIHPPTLFLGFAMTQIPFAYAIAGLWRGEHKLWIQKSFAWVLVGAAILGVGIMMGAFWAYETLNFGGYWNWDPVENAVFVPWISLIALLHTFTLNERKSSAYGLSYILAILTFILIVYSTFLTRSGVLGSSSVHSFTDLGLSAQLLLFLLMFFFGSIAFLVYKWKSIPKSKEEAVVYSREFWIFAGLLVFAFCAFQVLLATSFPVFNSLGTAMGFDVNLAPPSNQIQFYANFQIWTAVLLTFVGGIGQYVWWNKIELKTLFTKVLWGASIVLIFLALGYVIVFLMDQKDGIYQKIIFENDTPKTNSYIIRVVSFILLIASSCFALLMASISLYRIRKSFWKLSGGALAHIGVAIMLLGILFSAGYSKVVSINNQGVISKEFTNDQNKENIVLWRHTSYDMGDYRLSYTGQYYQNRNSFEYINTQDVQLTDSIGMGIIKKDIPNFKEGDTLFFAEENVYYRIKYASETDTFEIYPRVQQNEKMGGILPSPEIKRYATSDIYSYIASVPTEGDKWSDTLYQTIGKGDTIIVNDYVGFIDSIAQVTKVSGVNISKINPDAVAFKLYIRFLGKSGNEFLITPAFMLRNMYDGASFFEVSDDLGVSIFVKDWPKPTISDKYILGINTSAVDYVIFHAEHKPMINLVWIGTLLTAFGFVVAAIRRKKESTQIQNN